VYDLCVFVQSRGKGVCDAYRGETRLEVECERRDGVVFLFRRTHCVPQDLYMYARQPTRCVAAWTQEHSTFNRRSASITPHPTAALVTIVQCNTLVALCSRQLIGPAEQFK